MLRFAGVSNALQPGPDLSHSCLSSVAHTVSNAEIAAADALVADLKANLLRLSQGDPRALFALRRRVLARLKHDDDSTMSRRKLQIAKYAEQGGACAICGLSLSRAGALLHRRDQRAGFTVENTQVVHDACQSVPGEKPSAGTQR